MTIEHFADKQGQAFELFVTAAEPLPLTLVEVRAAGKSNDPARFRDPFFLFFEGTPGRLCPQSIYRVRHGSGWEAELFLVPIGDKPDGTYVYQSVFA
jgi:hypothetical protein